MTEPLPDRRSASGDRRKYNRREAPVTPPYYEVFERIAVALEKAVTLLDQRQVTLPDRPVASAVAPRRSSDRS